MNFEYKDCYARFDGESLIFGNLLAEEKILLSCGVPTSEYLLNKTDGYFLRAPQGQKFAFCNIPGFDFTRAEVSFEASVYDCDSLSEEQLCAILRFAATDATLALSFRIFPENRFISAGISVKGRLYGATGSEDTNEADDGIETGKGSDTKKAAADVKTPATDVIFPAEGAIFALPICEKHIKTREIEFFDVTDRNNTLVRESDDCVYVRHAKRLSGQMFFVDCYIAGETLMLVKDAPSAAGRLKDDGYDLSVASGRSVEMMGSVDFENLPGDEENELYFCTYGIGKREELPEEYKSFYRRSNKKMLSDGLIRMSNTWGDRNQDAAVREDFVLREVENAARLGVNVLQVDDGWQKGASANSKLVKSNIWGRGYYDSDKDFWTTHPEKFPNGFKPIVEKLGEHGIRFALWFSPDLENDYANWQKDAETLLSLYKNYGACYFKLDGINIRSQKEENNLLRMLRYVIRESRGEVSFNFDITAGRRWGYIYRKEFGTVFIENRYTDWGAYYPHYTLRGLWQLSKYLPLARFQSEFLNLRRNREKYGDSPLAPDSYGMDYAFAVTMFACPLYWFELQNLSESDKSKLSDIAKIHSEISHELARANVTPLGEEPDGMSFTGFCAELEDGHGYLLLFRESGEDREYGFACDLPDKAELMPLYLSDESIRVEKASGAVRFYSEAPRSFALLKY